MGRQGWYLHHVLSYPSLRIFKDLADSIAAEPGLIWKAWTENEAEGIAGGQGHHECAGDGIDRTELAQGFGSPGTADHGATATAAGSVLAGIRQHDPLPQRGRQHGFVLVDDECLAAAGHPMEKAGDEAPFFQMSEACLKDTLLLTAAKGEGGSSVESLVRRMEVVSERSPVPELLERLLETGEHIALVVAGPGKANAAAATAYHRSADAHRIRALLEDAGAEAEVFFPGHFGPLERATVATLVP